MAELTIADIKAAVHEVLEEQRRNFWVEPEQHFLDHDMLKVCRLDRDIWRENHRFITDIREGVGTAKKVGVVALVTALCGLCGYMLKLLWVAVLQGPK